MYNMHIRSVASALTLHVLSISSDAHLSLKFEEEFTTCKMQFVLHISVVVPCMLLQQYCNAGLLPAGPGAVSAINTTWDSTKHVTAG